MTQMDVSSIIDPAKSKQNGDKNLKAGDFFGEISLLFGCRRTATVKAKQYCECACIQKKQFSQLISNHGIFKSYLTMNIMKEYDDELRLFLVSCLRKIDYLQNVGLDILTHLSMHMIAQTADKDTDLYTASSDFKPTEAGEIAIIFNGRLAITTQIEKEADNAVIEYIAKGAILNAHNSLTKREHFATVKCLTAVTYYYLPVEIISQLCQAYPKMREAFKDAQQQSFSNKINDLNPVDYQEVDFDIKAKYGVSPHLNQLSHEEKKRVPELRLIMKNAVLHHLNKVRERTKMNKLTDILEQALKQKMNVRLEKVVLSKLQNEMNLTQKLDSIDNNQAKIFDENFDKL